LVRTDAQNANTPTAICNASNEEKRPNARPSYLKHKRSQQGEIERRRAFAGPRRPSPLSPSGGPPPFFAFSPALFYLTGDRSLSALSRLYARLFLMGVGGSTSQTIGYPHDIGR